MSLSAAIVGGAIVSMMLTLLLVALEATLMDKQILTVDKSPTMANIIWIMSAAVGSLIAAGIAGSKKLIVALAAGGGYALILLLITGFAYNAKYSNVLKGVLLIVLASVVTGFLTARRGGRKTKRPRFR